MREINLTQEKVALVDDEDYQYLNSFKWYAMESRKTFYAVRRIRVNGKQNTVWMHGEILNGKGIDHIDHDGLNNQKSNLRFCTPSQNLMNTRKRENTSSVYKGVYFYKQSNKWRAQIMINGKYARLGCFASEVDAARAYNTKAIELFCEFANLNIVD